MSRFIPGETEFERCNRLGREAEARAAIHDAAIAEHKRRGTHIRGSGVAGIWWPQRIADGRQ